MTNAPTPSSPPPVPANALSSSSAMRVLFSHRHAAPAALLLLCLFLFFGRLGSVPIFDLDEALYVTCAKQMVGSGDWITPRLNLHPAAHPALTAVPFFEKPILVYWLCAASLRAFGVTEWAARLPAALAALLTVGAIVWAGMRWFGRRAGLLAGLVYAVVPMTVYNARQMTTDGLLVGLFTAAMLLFRVASETETEKATAGRAAWGFWAVCALAVLTKGAIGLLLPLLVIGTSLLLTRLSLRVRKRGTLFAVRWRGVSALKRGLLALQPVGGLVLFLAIAAPWHLLVVQQKEQDTQSRTWTQEYVIRQHVGRFRGGDKVHNAPLPTYFVFFGVFFFPWACFAPAAFRLRLHTMPGNMGNNGINENSGHIGNTGSGSKPGDAPATLPERANPAPHSASEARETHRFLLVWFWTIFVFFSLSAAKLPAYIAPAYPAAALLVGRWLEPILFASGVPALVLRSLRRSAAGATGIGLLLFMAALLLPRFAPANAPVAVSVVQFARLVGLLLFAGSLAAWLCFRTGNGARVWRRRGMGALAAMNVLFVGVAITVGFAAARSAILAPYQQIARDARADALNNIPVIYYHVVPRRPSMNFYAGYAPFERKETPLLPYLNRVLPGMQEGDIVTARVTFDTLLQPEIAALPGASLRLLSARGGRADWVLLRLKLPPPAARP